MQPLSLHLHPSLYILSASRHTSKGPVTNSQKPLHETKAVIIVTSVKSLKAAEIITPVNTEIASISLMPPLLYDRDHRFHTVLAVNFGENSTLKERYMFTQTVEVFYLIESCPTKLQVFHM